jgi:DNA (cytosine-5)-methyltransferase 1
LVVNLGSLKVVSLFSGCGGLDLGFTRAGFELVYANDNNPVVWETFEKNHKVAIDKRSLFEIKSSEIPSSNGIIGGPPCQSWSLAGKMRGASDERGQLFYEYVRVLREKNPDFFLAENVPGIVSTTHIKEFEAILKKLAAIGYRITYRVVDARDYGIPQERRRVIIIGYKNSLNKRFVFPPPTHSRTGSQTIEGKKTKKWITLQEAIGDLPQPIPAQTKNRANESLPMPNHEFMNGSFSTIYMSRNRKKNWEQQSYTIQAGGRHAPLHPSSAQMAKIGKDEWKFTGSDPVFRRLSVRECARIQTFPDDFIFYYRNVGDGYTMVGNAVPVKLAKEIARKIRSDLASLRKD